MKKLIRILCLSSLLFTSCTKDNSKIITVGATPSPHATILNSEAVQAYVKEQGFTLNVKVYQDYVTPNKALQDDGLDANYFQHIPYLQEEIKNKNYDLSAACQVHNEPLNLYSKNNIESYQGKTISIVNDASNVERAYKLLLKNEIITSYDITNFDAQHPSYTTELDVTIECIDPGLLARKVEDDGIAVIPGNYALNAWDTSTLSQYKVLGETTEDAHPNIIAVKTANLNSEKTNVLVAALSQESVKTFVESTYGATVNYCFEDLRK